MDFTEWKGGALISTLVPPITDLLKIINIVTVIIT